MQATSQSSNSAVEASPTAERGTNRNTNNDIVSDEIQTLLYFNERRKLTESTLGVRGKFHGHLSDRNTNPTAENTTQSEQSGKAPNDSSKSFGELAGS